MRGSEHRVEAAAVKQRCDRRAYSGQPGPGSKPSRAAVNLPAQAREDFPRLPIFFSIESTHQAGKVLLADPLDSLAKSSNSDG